MQEHHLPVARTARYYTLGDAPPPSPACREVWFVCHGYGQLAGRFLRHFAALDDGTRLVVAPEGLSRFYVGSGTGAHEKVGAAWMTREDRLAEIHDYVTYLDAVYAEVLRRVDRRAVRVHALGYSQGTATVSRWVAFGTAQVDRVVLWGGEVPPDLDLAAARERFSGTGLTLVAGRADEFLTPKVVARDEERLRRHGIPCRVVAFDGGHEIDEATLKALVIA
jgi:predicted esterase